MIRIKSEAGWKHKFLLTKEATLTGIKRDIEDFVEDKKLLESLGYSEIELSFVRTPGEANKGKVFISLVGGSNLLGDLSHSDLLLDYEYYLFTMQSFFQPEDVVEEMEE